MTCHNCRQKGHKAENCRLYRRLYIRISDDWAENVKVSHLWVRLRTTRAKLPHECVYDPHRWLAITENSDTSRVHVWLI